MFREWIALAERAVKALETIAKAMIVRSGATQPDEAAPRE